MIECKIDHPWREEGREERVRGCEEAAVHVDDGGVDARFEILGMSTAALMSCEETVLYLMLSVRCTKGSKRANSRLLEDVEGFED